MREIDFRMWDSTSKKYFNDPLNVFDCLKHQSFYDKKLGFLAFDHIAIGRVFEQYTGLKDKNGVKIFGGDICSVEFHDKTTQSMVVEWNEEIAGFIFKDIGNGAGFWRVSHTPVEVVGNINENPEMVNL